MNNKYYITTAIVYTSGKPHIGNAYDIVLADAIARYKREMGYDVYFMTGTDEHGEKIEKKANDLGVTPKEFVDSIALEVKKTYDMLDATYDRFIRTTDEDHVKACQNIFQKLYDKGDIYKDTYEGWYCTPCESFFTDSQLVQGKCPDCGREVYKAKEEAYFFKMSKYADRLIEYIKESDFIKPDSRKNEMLNNFLLPGLKDLCVSRSTFTWGIEVPFDKKHVIYVWLDALNNYITGLGYDTKNNTDLFNKYWPADLHVIGKDIVRFHTIYWPIFLMALDLPLPKKVFGHPWLLAASDDNNNEEGEKMSKSRGNVLYPDKLCEIFGTDSVRFYLLHEMPYDNDGVINIKLFTEKFNVELANTLGNLVSRVIAMINKYHDGKIENNIGINDMELYDTVNKYICEAFKAMDNLHVQDAMINIFSIFRRLNKYIDETEPWALAKDASKENRLKEVLYNLATNICKGAEVLKPFMPSTAEKILNMYGVSDINLNNVNEYKIKNGTMVTKEKENLFVRLDIKDVLEKLG